MLARGDEDVLVHANAVGDEPAPAARGRVGGGRGPDSDLRGAVAGPREPAGVPDRGQDRQMQPGPVAAPDVVGEFVQVVGKGVLGVRSLIELGEHVAADVEQRVGGGAAEVEVDAVFPLYLVAEMVLVTRIRRIVGVELLVGVPERDWPECRVKRRAARVTPVIVPKRAARGRIDRRMPRGIELAVWSDDRVAIVDFRRAIVFGPGGPDTVRLSESGRCLAARRGRRTVAAERGGHEKGEG